MKILVVDDEELARSRLLRMLNTLGFSDTSEAINADEAIEMIKKESHNLVFLDINMPHINGLELAYELKYHDNSISVIFQTAYEEYALKAFDIGAVGYLVKPYSLEQLKQAIERVHISEAKNADMRILSKVAENYLLLKPSEIYYIKADLSEVMLRSAKGFSYLGQKISDLQKKLASHNFIQIHRSYLINMDEIKEIQTIEQSKLRFKFKNCNDTVESSKEGAKNFRDRFSF